MFVAKPHSLLTLVAVSLLMLAGCASAPEGDGESRTMPTRVLPIVSVGAAQLADYWRWQEPPVIESPVSTARQLQYGCVLVNFGIDVDGHSFDVQVRKSYPQGRFADASIALVKSWQFDPSDMNPVRQPVRTEQLLIWQAIGDDARLVSAEHVGKFCRS